MARKHPTVTVVKDDSDEQPWDSDEQHVSFECRACGRPVSMPYSEVQRQDGEELLCTECGDGE